MPGSVTSESPTSSSNSLGKCSSHGEPLVVYCIDCGITVCGICLTDGSHYKHAFNTLKKGFEEHIDSVTKRVKMIKNSLKKQTGLKSRVMKAKNELDDVFSQAKENVAEQYCQLRELMDQNMQQAFLLIQALRERTIMDMDQLAQFGEEYEEKSKSIHQTVKQLKGTQEADDAVILAKIEEVETGIEELEDYHTNLSEMIAHDNKRLRALEDSISRIVQMNKDLLPRPWEFGENITFDVSPTSLNEDVKISGDNTRLQLAVSHSPSKGRRRKAMSAVNILASESFTEGSHYWEVNVRNCEYWTVGVVEQDWLKKGIQQPLGQDKRSWVLQMDGDSLAALNNDDIIMIREAPVEQLGVFLQFKKKGKLQFFNVLSGALLHTFSGKFKNPIFPAFNIESQNGSTAMLRLCDLMPKAMEANYDGEERRLSTDSGIHRAMNNSAHTSETSKENRRADSQSITSESDDHPQTSDAADIVLSSVQ
ncbi:hypothetical protein GJAV_G00070710 [Gymnothorax javanicus]|nr:hypothetical protein GJAV_G00070710 [Gymnothorax javanicus]